MENVIYGVLLLILIVLTTVNVVRLYFNYVKVRNSVENVEKATRDIYMGKGFECDLNSSGDDVIIYPYWDNESMKVRYKCVVVSRG